MNKPKPKLMLKKETLRDLMVENAGQVKGGIKSKGCFSGAKECGPPTEKHVVCTGACTGDCWSNGCW